VNCINKFIGLVLGLFLFVVSSSPVLAIPKEDFVPVTLCHSTGSESNPYEEITVDNEGQLNGHENHEGDIIPAPEEGCPQPEEPKDYCDTLEGVQAEDEDCPQEEEPCPEGQILVSRECTTPEDPVATPSADPKTPTPKVLPITGGEFGTIVFLVVFLVSCGALIKYLFRKDPK